MEGAVSITVQRSLIRERFVPVVGGDWRETDIDLGLGVGLSGLRLAWGGLAVGS